MENDIKCCLCGCEETTFTYADVVRCVNCKIFIKQNLPTKDQIKVQLKDFLLSACWNEGTRKERLEDAKWQLDHLEKYTSPGKVFDVGAAGGFFMKAARDRGWEVEGNDVSDAAIKWAKENFNLSIHYDFFEDIDLLENEYDAVVLWNTLEHTHDPAETINIVKRILKPNGLIYIQVPETPTPALLRRYYEPYHFYEFNFKSLSHYLESQGFVEREVHKSWKRDALSETDYLYQLGEET